MLHVEPAVSHAPGLAVLTRGGGRVSHSHGPAPTARRRALPGSAVTRLGRVSPGLRGSAVTRLGPALRGAAGEGRPA